MDATLAFALRNFQDDQTEAMQAEVTKVQAEREQQMEAVGAKHRAQTEHLQARALVLRGKVGKVESVQPRLDTFGTEILASVVEDCTQKLEAVRVAAEQTQRTHAAETAENYSAVLQIELAESKKLTPKEETELKQLLALLAPGGGDAVARLAAAEAIMLGHQPVAGGGGVAGGVGGGGGGGGGGGEAIGASPSAAPSEGEPPAGHQRRFRGGVDQAEAAAQQLRRQAFAQGKLSREWRDSKKKKGPAQRYAKLLGQLPGESWAAAAAAANEAADGISAQSRQMEEVYRARSAELEASKEQFLQDVSQRKISQARAEAEAEPEPALAAAPMAAGGGGMADAAPQQAWYVELDTGWTAFDGATQTILRNAATQGTPEVTLTRGTQSYKVDLAALLQTNVATGYQRRVRAPAEEDASLDQDFQQWCDQTIEMQQRYDAVEREGVEQVARHKQEAMASQRVESGKMLSSAVQQFSGRAAAGGGMAGGVAERIRAEAQAAEQQAEAAAAALRAQIDAQKVVDVAFLSARNEDVADREPVPMCFQFDADIGTWEGRKDAFLAKLARQLGVPPSGIDITNVRAGSIYIDLNVALPPGMGLDDFINAARLHAAQADADIRHVLLGSYDLQLPEDTMDPKWNKEYGPGKTRWRGASPGDRKDRGKDKMASNGCGVTRKVEFSYRCPVGWKRYGLQISKDFDAEYAGWPVAYHGTATSTAAAILNTALRQSGGAAGGTAVFGNGVYLTPSIRYASWNRYAKWYGPMENGHYVQLAFQCRVNPAHISTIAQQTCGTVAGVDHQAQTPGNSIDPNINNADMEWVVRPNGLSPHGNLFVGDDQVVCYGIMLREVVEKPAFPN